MKGRRLTLRNKAKQTRVQDPQAATSQMISGEVTSAEESHSKTLVTVSASSQAKLTSSWGLRPGNTGLEFGILVCFASFHFAFQLAVKPRRITNSKVLAVVVHRSLLQASAAAKDSKITQNREAKKAKQQAMFLPSAMDATEKHRQLAIRFCFK